MTATEQRRTDFEAWADCEELRDEWPRKAWLAAAELYERKGMERAMDICRQWAEGHRRAANESIEENCDYRIAAEDCAAAIEREIQKC